MARPRTRLSIVAAIAIGGLLIQAGGVTAATALPTRVYAPYFETWTTDSLTTVSQQSGVKHFTLAFLETTSKSSCTLAWDGDKAQPVSGGRYLSEIAALRAAGGDVIPSLGGWSADQGGTEIGDSCKDVNAIFVAYRDLVLKYEVGRIDMDIEGRSLTKADGIDRRNKAIKLAQDWATSQGRPLTISYTLPTSASGLEASGLAVLQNAKANGVRIDFVEPMVFDYYDRTTTNMGQAAINALNGLHAQLHTLLPSLTDAQLWAMEGATIMNGIDDYPKKTEVTTLADTQLLRDFAVSHGMSALSMWAIQRDNGNCPGVGGANDCSGIAQSPWAFSDILKTFATP
jgi:hypothetical protein